MIALDCMCMVLSHLLYILHEHDMRCHGDNLLLLCLGVTSKLMIESFFESSDNKRMEHEEQPHHEL